MKCVLYLLPRNQFRGWFPCQPWQHHTLESFAVYLDFSVLVGKVFEILSRQEQLLQS